MHCESFAEATMATKNLVEREVKYRLLKLGSRVCRLHNTPQYWLTKRMIECSKENASFIF
jgi:hypothetical protein